MAKVIRLNDDVLLVKQPGVSPELTSRVTGGAMPLDDEQAIVVDVLSDGPVDDGDLMDIARQQGVEWDHRTMELFVDNLERWGLVDREEQTPTDDVPRGFVHDPHGGDVDDSVETGVSDPWEGSPPQVAQPEDETDVSDSWEPAAEDAFPASDTQVVAMDSILPPSKPKAGVAVFTPDAQAGANDPTGTAQTLDMEAEEATAGQAAVLREEAAPKPPVASRKGAKTIDMSEAAAEAQRPTQSGEEAQTLEMSKEVVAAGMADLEQRPTESGQRAPTMEPLPLDSPPELEEPTRSAKPVLRLVPPEIAQSPVQEEPTVQALGPPKDPAIRPPGRRHSSRPASSRAHSSRPPAPGRRHSSRPPPQASGGSLIPSPSPQQIVPDPGEHPLYPRLVPKWMPKLLPQSRNILLVDPAARTERELRSWEYQIARMMQGTRSPVDVAEWAQSVGMHLHLNDVFDIIERLVQEGVLEAGSEPLNRPEEPSRSGFDTTGSSVIEAVEATSGSPFKDLGESPDSIMESLDVLAVPGKGQRARVAIPSQEISGDSPPLQMSATSADLPEEGMEEEVGADSGITETDLSEALTRAASLVQQKMYGEAEQLLKSILEIDPGAVQALAMLELIRGEKPAPAEKRRLAPWIALGISVLMLFISLVLLFGIKVQPKEMLACQTELIPSSKITSPITGRVTEVMASKGNVVDKGQKLARVSDDETKQRIVELQQQIDDKEELLRIMKTTGSVADERKQKKILKQLKNRLDQYGSCKDADCRRKLDKVNEQIKSAKLKLKFCEWQAEPDEIQQLADKLEKLKQTLAPLAKRSLAGPIVSPAKALVTSVKIARGKQVKRDSVVATTADATRFRVLVKLKGQLPKMLQAKVKLVHKGSTQTYTPTPKATRRGNTLVFEVPAEVNHVPEGATCQVEITKPKISLLRSWF